MDIQLKGQKPVEPMWVTTYVDASFKEGIAAYAVWLKCATGRDKKAERCPDEINDALQAELYGIEQAIKLAMTRKGAEGVLVACDCQSAIRLSWPWSDLSKNRITAGIQKRIRHLRKSIEIRTKWVKGHSSSRFTAGWLNNWCDKEAGKLVGRNR